MKLKEIPYLLLIVTLVFSCTENNSEKFSKQVNSKTMTNRSTENEIYAQTVMIQVLEERILTNYYILALINNEIEIDGLDTNQNPEVLEYTIEQDVNLLHYLLNGPVGPVPLPRPPRPCLHDIYSVVDNDASNFLHLNSDELQDISSLMIHICMPEVTITDGHFKIIFNKDLEINNLIISQENQSVSEITHIYQNSQKQTIVELNTDFKGKASLQFNLNIPEIDMQNIQIESIIVRN